MERCGHTHLLALLSFVPTDRPTIVDDVYVEILFPSSPLDSDKLALVSLHWMESTDSVDMEMTRRGLRSFTRNFCNQSMQRLSKAISSTGMFSRREAEKMISDGRIKVNYNPISSVSQKVTEKDKIFVDDIELKSNVYTDRRPRLWIVSP